MQERLESIVGDYQIYERRGEYEDGNKIPFRVSPYPLGLLKEQTKEINDIGGDIVSYFWAVDELYREDEGVKELLNRGKPEFFLVDRPSHYLFVRPDLIITNSGFSICEIETSPFGLALSEILNRAYIQEGFETLVGEETLTNYVQRSTPTEGVIVYSQKTASYKGQLMFLADHVFARNWTTKKTEVQYELNNEPVYRGFYLYEYLDDPNIRTLLESDCREILPSLTPHLEEKAILALLWDKRWEKVLEKRLGRAVFNHLRKVIPPIWIVGQEVYFSQELPPGISTSVDLANLSHSKRTFVLKPSGFNKDASWSRGVVFLHEKSRVKAREGLNQAQKDITGLHIVQQFRKGVEIPIEYEHNGEIIPMTAKVRLTPYFDMKGKLISIKATGCEKTNYIHATSSSINTSVMSQTERFF